MYYLWRDKKDVYYITDYKEIQEDGKVKIDNYGYLEVELVFSSKVKTDLIAHAHKLAMEWKGITLIKDIDVFGYKFSKDNRVSIAGDILIVSFGDKSHSVDIPIVCSAYDKTSSEFMEELYRLNN